MLLDLLDKTISTQEILAQRQHDMADIIDTHGNQLERISSALMRVEPILFEKEATGYPFAHVAAKILLAVDLVSIKNRVTETTSACFELSLDYIGENTAFVLSLGEVMSRRPQLQECIQKAVRMANPSLDGSAVDNKRKPAGLDAQLSHPTDERLFYIISAFAAGTIERVHELTEIGK
eukprot:jgi/Phyca11/12765/fgenesh1_pg.PHYCAscaffold_1_\